MRTDEHTQVYIGRGRGTSEAVPADGANENPSHEASTRGYCILAL